MDTLNPCNDSRADASIDASIDARIDARINASTDARLCRIESSLLAAQASARRWRTGALVCGGLLGASLLVAAAQEATIPDVLRAKRLEIVGEDNQVTVMLRSGDTGGQFDVWNAKGGNIVRITGNDHGGDVAVWNNASAPVGGLFASELGGRIEIGDVKGATLATLARGEEGGAMILSGPGEAASSLRCEAGGAGAVVSMRRADGSVGFLAGVAHEATLLSMRNQSNKEILFAGGATDQAGVLRLADAAGNETAALTSLGGGGLLLKDGTGGVVASLSSLGASKGGVFELMNGSGHAAASIDCKDDGSGRFVVSASDGSPAFAAEANGTAGTLAAYRDGRRVAAIGAGESGGLLNLLDMNGQPVVVAGMASDGDGGALSLRNLRGVAIARIGVDAVGAGEVAVYNSTATFKKVINAPTAPKE